MSIIQEFVQHERSHKNVPTQKKGVGTMVSENPPEEKYAATYHFGNTVVHVVPPPPMSEEEKQRRIDEFYKAAWQIIKSWNLRGRPE